MTYTYDVATNRGKVRLLIPDRIEADAVFTDAEIDAYLSMYAGEPGTVHLAAAEALETLASDEALVLKVISTNGLSTNGAAVANSLLQRSARLRAKGEAMLDDGFCGFDIAEFADSPTQAAENVIKGALRDG